MPEKDPIVVPEADDEVFAAIVTAKGEVHRFPPGVDLERRIGMWGPSGGGKTVFNGGTLSYVAAFLAGAITSGVVGNAAWDALRLGARNIRLRFATGRLDEHELYARYIAELKVRAMLDLDVALEVGDCVKREDHWAVVVKSPANVYRVRIPLRAPDESVISVDLD